MNGTYGLWKVVGKREYMGVAPGQTFEAQIKMAAARRAVDRGDIVLLEWVTPCIDMELATFPKGWLE